MTEARPVLRLGDRVSFGGEEHLVAGLAGTSVRLRADSGAEPVVLAGHLMSAPDFAVLDAAGLPAVEPFGLLESLPAEVVADAERWRDHLVEINIGSAWVHSFRLATFINQSDPAPWLHPRYQASQLLRAGPPAFLRDRYSAPHGFCRLEFSLSPPPLASVPRRHLHTFHTRASSGLMLSVRRTPPGQ
jgi:hypothetical protein